MRRRVFNLAALLSVLLCAATVVLWVRSYSWCAGILWTTPPQVDASNSNRLVSTNHMLQINQGLVHLIHSRHGVAEGELVRQFQWTISESAENDMEWAVLPPYLLPRSGFVFGFADGLVQLVVPAWFATLLLLILPAAWTFDRLRKRVPRRKGTCTNCAYDLTGNVSGVCPECGTAVVGKAEGVA